MGNILQATSNGKPQWPSACHGIAEAVHLPNPTQGREVQMGPKAFSPLPAESHGRVRQEAPPESDCCMTGKFRKAEETSRNQGVVFVPQLRENTELSNSKSTLRSPRQRFIVMQRGEEGSASMYATRTIIILMHFNKHYMQNHILIDQNSSHPNYRHLK